MKLVDALGTAYVYTSYKAALENIIKECIQKDDVLDIAGAHLTPDAAGSIRAGIQQGLHPVDSEDKDRDYVLQEAIKQIEFKATHDSSQDDVLPIPESAEAADLIAYLRSLDPSKVYSVRGLDVGLVIPLVTVIMYYRPQINVNMGGLVTSLYNYVMETLFRRGYEPIIESNKSKEWILCTHAGRVPIVVPTTNLSKPFNVVGLGDVTWNALLDEYLIVPKYFGNVAINTDPELKALWRPVLDKAMNALAKYMSTSKRSLIGFLKEEFNNEQAN